MKTEKCDVSFCLPVYNAEKYIVKCLDSIIRVKDVSYEIICVDDCSTDNSFEILKKYCEEHPDCDIHIFQNEKNQGVSFSRNVAMDNANGRYIHFVDSDDMIVAESVKYHVEVADRENLDATLSDFADVPADSDYPEREFDPEYVLIENSYSDPNFGKIWSVGNGRVMQSVLSGLYRRSFIEEYSMRFPDNVYYGEDIVFNFPFLVHFKKVAKFSGLGFYYRQSPNSLSRSYNEGRQKRCYLSSVETTRIYEGFLKNGVYNTTESKKSGDIETLKIKILQTKQNNVNWLASVNDIKYIREQLKSLKKEGLYPYPFIKDAIGNSGLRGVLFYLLPVEFFFWVLVLVYKINRLIRKR